MSMLMLVGGVEGEMEELIFWSVEEEEDMMTLWVGISSDVVESLEERERERRERGREEEKKSRRKRVALGSTS